ncbi:unnamed protein product [Calicophoron daubneyi]|uniref:Ephexin-1 n=1 Tax=Calicophoron daubneyi TaxID=300641 RepID=A0AAV2U2B3_CALDB
MEAQITKKDEIMKNRTNRNFTRRKTDPGTSHFRTVGDVRPERAQAENNSKEQKSNQDSSSHDHESSHNVTEMLRETEQSYDFRNRYCSIFEDIPLYQMYDMETTADGYEGRAKRMTLSKEFLRRIRCETRRNYPRKSNSDSSPILSGSDESLMDENEQMQSTRHSSGDNVHTDATDVKNESKPPSPSKTDPLPMDEVRPIDQKSLPVSPAVKVRSSSLSLDNSLPAVRKLSSTNSIDQSLISSSGGMYDFTAEMAGIGPNRPMWSRMPQVVNLHLADNLSKTERKLQEALFEIITSEASYYRSLNVLIEVFYKAPWMQPGIQGSLISSTDKHHLFSNVLAIHMTSENLLRDMETCFREDPMLVRLCYIVYEHAEGKFNAYKVYIQNQMYQTRTLEKILKEPLLATAIKALQELPQCRSLDLNSFLLLPLQRVTRLRLLVNAVLHYALKNTPVYHGGLIALASLEKVIAECDAKKSHMEQKERLMNLCTLFDYKQGTKPISTANRRLIKEGELRLVTVAGDLGTTIRNLFSNCWIKSVYLNLFLFNDLLVIARKCCNQRLVVDASCPTSHVRAEILGTSSEYSVTKFYSTEATSLSGSSASKEPAITNSLSNSGCHSGSRLPGLLEKSHSPEDNPEAYTFRLILETPPQPTVVYIFQAKSLAERERWIDAISPPKGDSPENLFLQIMDCPQVLVTKSYAAQQSDELELKEGDQASILVSLSDGWYKGVLPDGRRGWFPSNVCIEVRSAVMRRKTVRNFMLREEAQSAYHSENLLKNWMK